MEIGTIIVTYNSAPLVERALASVFNSRGRLSHRVVVVENGSTDNTLEVLASLWATYPFKVIKSTNKGFAAGVNIGLRALGFGSKKAKPAAVLLLNPDAQLASSTLGLLVSRFDSQSNTGIVAPRLVYPNGAPQSSNFGPFPTRRTQLVRFLKLHKLFPWGHYIHPNTAPIGLFTTERSVDWVSGGAMLIRREVIEKVGFWDENFFLYVEDIDYCRRARLAGFDVRYVPSAIAYHKLGASFEGGGNRTRQPFKRSAQRFRSLRFWFSKLFGIFNFGIGSSRRRKLPKGWERESMLYYFRKYAGRPKLYYAATDLHREPAGLTRLNFIVGALAGKNGSLKGRRTLDVGAGRGSVSLALAALGARVTALDKDASTVAELTTRAKGTNVRAVLANILTWKSPRAYDAVIASEVLEHFPLPERALKKIATLLKPGGLLVATVPNGGGLEERLRRWGLKSVFGKRFKKRFRPRLAKAGVVQSCAESPHRVFLSFKQWQEAAAKAGFRITATGSQSVGFKSWFYILGRLFLKRDSVWFRRLDWWDARLTRFMPVRWGDGFMFVARK